MSWDMFNFNTSQGVMIFLTEAFSVVAAVAGVSASILMYSSTKRIGSGILAVGFKRIAIGVVFVAAGIIIDGFLYYLQLPNSGFMVMSLFMLKGICFLVGTYIIVIGSKTTTDKLETLTG